MKKVEGVEMVTIIWDTLLKEEAVQEYLNPYVIGIEVFFVSKLYGKLIII
ncbi:hypothetical protein Ga0466249_004646 [Sporomusaceae bacterium BoRhaA]|nr:hypothetical protein [Pelorhabdus rhamnosifermentans]MBU2703501.1 hypothetical protein [Pelorhabdus rhamnosifermentans]